MNTEGTEISALLAVTKVLENEKIKLLICACYKENDEEQIKYYVILI